MVASNRALELGNDRPIVRGGVLREKDRVGKNGFCCPLYALNSANRRRWDPRDMILEPPLLALSYADDGGGRCRKLHADLLQGWTLSRLRHAMMDRSEMYYCHEVQTQGGHREEPEGDEEDHSRAWYGSPVASPKPHIKHD